MTQFSSQPNQYLPAYQVGDTVIKSTSSKHGLRFIGKVIGILTAEMLADLVTEDFRSFYWKEFIRRDKDFEKYPIYNVESCNKDRATLEEARSIVPGLSKAEYRFLMSLSDGQVGALFGPRTFLCLESDLLPLE